MEEAQQFTFADLFAGVGGFHAGLHAMGGRCVYAAEMDEHARSVNKDAWLPGTTWDGFPFARDVNDDAPLLPEGVPDDEAGADVTVPPHDVLTAGFPCQAFSKSGHQRGVLDKTRGTLFYNVLRVVKARQPKIVFLENVRNLVGPRHRETTFVTIIESLRELGYVVADEPTIISPHKLAPAMGGTPQVRDRVYIMAIRQDLVTNGTPFSHFEFGDWNPSQWRLAETPLPIVGGHSAVAPLNSDPRLAPYVLEPQGAERIWIDTYDRFLKQYMKDRGMAPGDGIRRLPGFPLWFRHQMAIDSEHERDLLAAEAQDYAWKVQFLTKNRDFYRENFVTINKTLRAIIGAFPESRTKLEWQAGSATSLWDGLIQLRPSGIRVKAATYAPALVAINQSPIYGPQKRRLAPLEAARLQGFPDWFSEILWSRPDRHAYKQMGNAVHVGAVQAALSQFVLHHRSALNAHGRALPWMWPLLNRASTVATGGIGPVDRPVAASDNQLRVA